MIIKFNTNPFKIFIFSVDIFKNLYYDKKSIFTQYTDTNIYNGKSKIFILTIFFNLKKIIINLL
jgi:hypothetical protein